MTTDLLQELRAYSSGNVVKKEQEPVVKKEEVKKVIEVKKEENSTSLDSDSFGFFDDELNEQRDNKVKAYGIFADDDLDEDQRNYGFYDEDLEEISRNALDSDFKLTNEDQEHFGFFDDVPEITPNSQMIINDIEEKTPTLETPAPVQNIAVRKQRVVSNDENDEQSASKKPVSNNNNSIRVNLDKIDLLMNNVGDLVITNAMLTQFSSTIEESKTRNSVLERLELLERHIRDMQDSIMSIRMVPMDSIYSKFPKVVRDISKKLGKKVEFKHYGDNVEIDKAMIEGLTDPLMHIIRNSLDHGIETPSERELTGKPDIGSISISAEQANGQMIITIQDDGKGINSDKVALKALEQGQIDENQYSTMSENEKAMLIFGAGVSTADEITDISGRGVGMDVVKTNIHKLGGAIKLDTHIGKGTTITIMLPLTLAILDGLDIKVGSQKYILPLSSIVESLQPTSEMIKKIGDGTQDLLMLREEFIPVVKLHQLFGLERSFNKLEEGMLIVVKSGNTKVALSIDEFLNQHQVVVKPLDKNFRSVQGIGAATVRGDGSIGLILDVIGIINAQIKVEKDMNSVKRAS
jgi:two-component system chemotaxis sensor kinase CheA